MIKILEKTIDLLYPQTCSICGKLQKKSLCNKCKVKLHKEYEFKTENYEKDLDKNFVEHYFWTK